MGPTTSLWPTTSLCALSECSRTADAHSGARGRNTRPQRSNDASLFQLNEERMNAGSPLHEVAPPWRQLRDVVALPLRRPRDGRAQHGVGAGQLQQQGVVVLSRVGLLACIKWRSRREVRPAGGARAAGHGSSALGCLQDGVVVTGQGRQWTGAVGSSWRMPLRPAD